MCCTFMFTQGKPGDASRDMVVLVVITALAVVVSVFLFGQMLGAARVNAMTDRHIELLARIATISREFAIKPDASRATVHAMDQVRRLAAGGRVFFVCGGDGTCGSCVCVGGDITCGSCVRVWGGGMPRAGHERAPQLAATLREVTSYIASVGQMRPARFLGIPANNRLVLSFVSVSVSAVSFALYSLNLVSARPV